MEAKAILLSLALAFGFWMLHRSWRWLEETRDVLAEDAGGDPTEARG